MGTSTTCWSHVLLPQRAWLPAAVSAAASALISEAAGLVVVGVAVDTGELVGAGVMEAGG